MSTRAETNVSLGSVTGVGLCGKVITRLEQELSETLIWEHHDNPQILVRQAKLGLLQGDVVLLGKKVEQPIRVVQQVHSFDKTIPVLILTEPEKCADLRRSIMFAPLLGNEVIPWSTADTDRLAQALSSAAERHRQRRHYLDTIASAQPKLGNLALSQPEVGHYLGRLLDQAPIGVISLDAKGCVLGINRQAGRILGISERTVPGLVLAEFFQPEARQRLANLLMRSAVAQHFGMNPEVFESVPIRSQIRYLEATASPISYRPGQRGFMVILQDVTARERAEQQRKKTEAHLRKLSRALEQAADAVMITDRNRIIEYVNPAFEALTGYSKDEAIGQKTYFLRSGVHDKTFYSKLWRTISSGRVFRGVLVNRRKDGTVYHEEKTIAPLRDGEGTITHYISTGHDITERLNAEDVARRHQAELAHVARLSTLGEMTSGLAHELNQPLCAITTYAQTCLRVLRLGHNDQKKLNYGLEQVVKQAELAGAIFQRLRNFARKEVQTQRVDLHELAHEVVKLIEAELAQHSIKLLTPKREGGAFVEADPIQIEQVLLNLIRNSIDAVIDLPVDRKSLELCIAECTDNTVKVSLKDRGTGCPADVVARLFEPFFTTKATGMGIGLGLSQSIIETHGGRLFLDDNSIDGATFSFTLPMAEAVAAQEG